MSKSSKSARDNRANQLNPGHPAYHQSRGASPNEAQRVAEHSKSALDNRANQLNPNSATDRPLPGEPEGSSTPPLAKSK